jgi:hypothetical protein
VHAHQRFHCLKVVGARRDMECGIQGGVVCLVIVSAASALVNPALGATDTSDAATYT